MMSTPDKRRVSAIVIDVGWGDCIFLESRDSQGDIHYGLVDCNDTANQRSGFLFVKRYLERQGVDLAKKFPLFDFVLLTHAHADHCIGLQRMISFFGTDWFWYPKSSVNGLMGKLLNYANRARKAGRRKVAKHQAVDNSFQLPAFGSAQMEILWPPTSVAGAPHDPNNENNNSVVLQVTLHGKSIVLTGDCEADNWQQIALPQTGLFAIQAPHHGARNGMFDQRGDTPWMNGLTQDTCVALSSHARPHRHPHKSVIAELKKVKQDHFRTDREYHLKFEIAATACRVQRSRFATR